VPVLWRGGFLFSLNKRGGKTRIQKKRWAMKGPTERQAEIGLASRAEKRNRKKNQFPVRKGGQALVTLMPKIDEGRNPERALKGGEKQEQSGASLVRKGAPPLS